MVHIRPCSAFERHRSSATYPRTRPWCSVGHMTALIPSRIFIAGGMPQETYVSRDHLGFENEVRKWANGAHTKLLSVSGPTKTGKTVLLQRFFEEGIWLTGGAIYSIDDFWSSICDELEVFTELEISVDSQDASSSSLEGGVPLGCSAERIPVARAGRQIDHSGEGGLGHRRQPLVKPLKMKSLFSS